MTQDMVRCYSTLTQGSLDINYSVQAEIGAATQTNRLKIWGGKKYFLNPFFVNFSVEFPALCETQQDQLVPHFFLVWYKTIRATKGKINKFSPFELAGVSGNGASETPRWGELLQHPKTQNPNEILQPWAQLCSAEDWLVSHWKVSRKCWLSNIKSRIKCGHLQIL